MKCSKCGNEIANDSVFCEYCGTKTRNDEQPIKTIDIRWALLPAMLIATIAMGFASESETLLLAQWTNDLNYTYTIVPVFVISLCLFVASCWFVLKKLVPLSFMVVMALLLYLNGLMLHNTINIGNYRNTKLEMGVHYLDNDTQNYVHTYCEAWCHNSDKNDRMQELVDDAWSLRRKLEADGKTVCDIDDMPTEMGYVEPYWNGIDAFMFALSITLVYLIYAIIAHKRAWKF